MTHAQNIAARATVNTVTVLGVLIGLASMPGDWFLRIAAALATVAYGWALFYLGAEWANERHIQRVRAHLDSLLPSDPKGST